MIIEKVKGDKVIWIVAILLSLLSLLAVYSSTETLAYRDYGGNTEAPLLKQFLIVLVGLVVMYIVHLVDYRYFSRAAQVLLGVSIILLVVTYAYGVSENDEIRRIRVPIINLTFQPSDLTRLALIMYIARFLAKNQDRMSNFKDGFLKIIIPILLITIMVFKTDFSSAVLIFTTSLALLFIGRISMKFFLPLLGIGVAGLVTIVFLSFHYPGIVPRGPEIESRIDQYFHPDPEKNDQYLQAKIAIATGGFVGKMPGNSTRRLFLQLAFSDYIYAFLIEEYGLLGGIVILFLYLVLLFRSVKIARVSNTKFGSFLVIGIILMLGIQTLMHMAVSVNLLPVTGQTLPFLSMGGSSYLVTCAGLGMVLSVSKYVEQNAERGQSLSYA
nr:FtsW/RodA/SpoVE family cell cycle protein [Bacteroidota bacterium]